MIPEDADIAFVLEGVPGVRGVYALLPRAGQGHDADYRYFIEMEHDQRAMAAVHYALLKILRHEDCQRIAIADSLPAALGVRARELQLSAPERFTAMSRVSARAAALAEARCAEEAAFVAPSVAYRAPTMFSALIFTKDGATSRVAREAFPEGMVAATSSFGDAVRRTNWGSFDLVTCPARYAFGVWGFLACVAEHRRALAEEIVIVADEVERDVVTMSLQRDRLKNRCLWKPVTAESFRLILEAPMGQKVVNRPSASASAAAASVGPNAQSPAGARVVPRAESRAVNHTEIVLVVDDEPDTEPLAENPIPGIHVIRVSDEWAALDKLALSEIDLVVCNAQMKVAGDKPLYRVLWNARPELKSRFALIVSPYRMPASVRNAGVRGAVTRPITADTIRDLLRERTSAT